MNLFLYGINDFGNFAMIIRSAEHFGLRHCYVYNADVSRNEKIHSDLSTYPKGLQRRLIRISSGALRHVQIEVVHDPEDFFAKWEGKGRMIAGSLRAGAVALEGFKFAENDCLLFGSEARGLPEEILERVSAEVKLAPRGETQSLNVAVAASLFMYEYTRQKGLQKL